MSVQVLQADARNLPLRDNSIDLVVASPPYYPDATKDSQSVDEYLDFLVDSTKEALRVLKPLGSIWILLGDQRSAGIRVERNGGLRPYYVPGFPPASQMGIPWRYAIRCMDRLNLGLRDEVVWDIPDGHHESWFHFTPGPDYFISRSESKYPQSVWSVRHEDEPEGYGFGIFPSTSVRRIIKGWCPPGGLVLDHFAGSGTTALVAEQCARDSIMIDNSAQWCAMIKERVNGQPSLSR